MRPILDAFRGVLGNRDLRLVELGFVCFSAVEYGTWIALLVYAFQRGGTNEASFVAVLMLVPAAIVAAPAAVLADRFRPARVLAAAYLVEAAGLAATAAAMWLDAPLRLVILCVMVAGLAMTLPRPTSAALMPFLARSADELTATNVVSSWAVNGSALAATFAAGVVLDLSGAAAVFLASAVLMVAAAVLALAVNGPVPVAAEQDGGTLDEFLAGIRVLRVQPTPRLLVGMLVLELTIFGALDLLCVVLAIDVLGLGDGWAGYLNASFAAGGAIGAVSAVVLVGRRRLAPAIAIGMVVWGISFVVIAAWPSAAVAVVLLIVGGVGRSIFDVGSRTLLQRTTPTETLARVFGVLEGLELGGLAVGALLVPLLVSLGGAKAALVGTGLVLVASVLLAGRALASVDRRATVPVVQIALLRSMRLFRLLPAPTLEGLAHALEPVRAPVGAALVEQGAVGDRFYAIAAGEVEVVADGLHVATLGRGDGFGEIALLDDVPRTATVVARTDVELYALERAPFVIAITGHAPSAQEASDMVARRRQELEATVAS